MVYTTRHIASKQTKTNKNKNKKNEVSYRKYTKLYWPYTKSKKESHTHCDRIIHTDTHSKNHKLSFSHSFNIQLHCLVIDKIILCRLCSKCSFPNIGITTIRIQHQTKHKRRNRHQIEPIRRVISNHQSANKLHLITHLTQIQIKRISLGSRRTASSWNTCTIADTISPIFAP